MKNIISIEMIDDWAGAAMQGIMSGWDQENGPSLEEVSSLAYEMAAEMAKARGEFIRAHEDDLVEESE